MNVVFTTRHMAPSPAARAYAEEKSLKLLRYYDRIQEIEIIFDIADRATKTFEVEIIVTGEHKKLFISKHQGDDANLCVDHCVKTLERQMSDHHKLVKNRKHPG
ncbi:MAG: ribosomal subunit interface protein [Capsulimonas sp.]|nr:ribosomal subunit interface protein [Capsulimonas sp.]